MIRKLIQKNEQVTAKKNSPAAEKLRLSGSYYDVALKQEISYIVEKVSVGSALM